MIASFGTCDAPCDGGVQTDNNGLTRACNLESCTVYDNNLLVDGRMETDLANSAWSCSSE